MVQNAAPGGMTIADDRRHKPIERVVPATAPRDRSPVLRLDGIGLDREPAAVSANVDPA